MNGAITLLEDKTMHNLDWLVSCTSIRTLKYLASNEGYTPRYNSMMNGCQLQ